MKQNTTLQELRERFADKPSKTSVYTIEGIVSQELWDKCREMEASVSQGKKNRTGVVLPLSGLAYCADC